jgi:hypothetical protein
MANVFILKNIVVDSFLSLWQVFIWDNYLIWREGFRSSVHGLLVLLLLGLWQGSIYWWEHMTDELLNICYPGSRGTGRGLSLNICFKSTPQCLNVFPLGSTL